MNEREKRRALLEEAAYKVFKEAGDYYGYPDCCIRSVAERAVKGREDGVWEELDENQQQVVDNKGFIPCPECAKKLVETNQPLSSLIKNRKCPTPYPNELPNELDEQEQKI